ncbi:hypothetical protein G7B40_031495 [Aetokthonos hydrillicola Thurmond2011]|jgi:hypothetical protein|uniref:Uncharacterized protein n=1 Tax=Aetokthonos hydrillicola Thurmond2011 TaxID=2712845 RepID=A0AAP5ICL4_9CYAN|nr:hypothetical protein [Aetokthonos hydrillicola]MBO3462854.1 hypothetical protein [Aetokthonos hydrillicola CCALA 1050]MBW4590979.1 hypothetical protein [Aetokthonos hydrillicola CCALA 1050]MDR9899051.1 hypothetical protein [Aetokthonos hydrillicola Thurmond2011]
MNRKRLISTEQWNRPGDNSPMTSKVWKSDGGVIYDMFLKDELIQSTFSPRPYKLGQACDGTIDTCTIALLISYCRDKKIDLQALLNLCYPNDNWSYFTKDYQNNKLTLAHEEGLNIPLNWNSTAFDGLSDSLTEINWHSAVGALEMLNSARKT